MRKDSQSTRCFFSGLSAQVVDPKYGWVVVPDWLTRPPNETNFAEASAGNDTVSEEVEAAAMARRKKGGPTSRKVYAIEPLAYIILSSRYIAITNHRRKNTQRDKWLGHIITNDCYAAPNIPDTSYTSKLLASKRSKAIGRDSAGWQYWVLGVQHRTSVRTLGYSPTIAKDRGNNIDHEPCLLIQPKYTGKSSAEGWLRLDIGKNPVGLTHLLEILSESSSARDAALRNRLIERLAACRMDLWRTGFYAMSSLGTKFLERKDQASTQLRELRDTLHMSATYATMIDMDKCNILEELRARCQEVRVLALLAWMHRNDESVGINLGHKQIKDKEEQKYRQVLDESVVDSLDLHPDKGYLRIDGLQKVRQAQPSLSASRMQFEPHLCEWVRFALRKRGYNLSQDHRVPFPALYRPLTLLESTKTSCVIYLNGHLRAIYWQKNPRQRTEILRRGK